MSENLEYYEYASNADCPNCLSNSVKRCYGMEEKSERIFECVVCGIYFQISVHFSVEKKQILKPTCGDCEQYKLVVVGDCKVVGYSTRASNNVCDRFKRRRV